MNAQDKLEQQFSEEATKEKPANKKEQVIDESVDYNQAPPKDESKDPGFNKAIEERVNKIKTICSDTDKIKLMDWQWNLIVLKHYRLPFEDVIDFAYNVIRLGANPFLKQIYLQERWLKKEGRYRGTIIISYHYMLAIANSTGEYDGCEIKFEKKTMWNPITRKDFDDLVCSVTIHRKGRQAFPVDVLFSEYADLNSMMWTTKGHTMHQKVGIAVGTRLAFPEILSGIFIAEELKDEAETEKALEMKNKIEQARLEAPALTPSLIGHQV